MKARRRLLIICLVALGGGLSALWLRSANFHPQKDSEVIASTNSKADASNGIPSSLEDMPIYPGAQNITKPPDPMLGGRWVAMKYDTGATLEDIATFYKDALARTGWVLGYDDRAYPRAPALTFYWLDPKDQALYWLDLSLQINDATASGDDTRYVQVALLRTPNPSKIPLYPGAMQSRVEYLPSQSASRSGFGTKITSYVTNASLSELKLFYISSLQSAGWKLIEDNSTTNNDSTYSFEFNAMGSFEALLWGTVAITATPDPSGQTQVELRVKGSRIRDELSK